MFLDEYENQGCCQRIWIFKVCKCGTKILRQQLTLLHGALTLPTFALRCLGLLPLLRNSFSGYHIISLATEKGKAAHDRQQLAWTISQALVLLGASSAQLHCDVLQKISSVIEYQHQTSPLSDLGKSKQKQDHSITMSEYKKGENCPNHKNDHSTSCAGIHQHIYRLQLDTYA